MQIEIHTTFTETDDNKWAYTAQFRINGTWIPRTGEIEKIESMTRLRQAVKKSVQDYANQYEIENITPETLILVANGMFKDTLSI